MRNMILLGAALVFAIGAQAQTNDYTVTNVVTNSKDARLVNPWGLSHPALNHHKRNEWWVADQATGYSTLYSANGTILDLAVSIPPAAGSGPGSPTGIASNSPVDVFAFVTLDGTISTWNAYTAPAKPGNNCYQCHVSDATIVVNHSSTGASYQGLTIATDASTGALTYYVANANGGIEAYDATTYSPVTFATGAFTDPKVPATYTPAGIQAIGSEIFVTYNASAGGGTGYVDAYSTEGKLLLRLQNGWFNQPWGVATSPADFGAFSSMILVGNTGSGWIGAYNSKTGAFQGFLQSGGTDLFIPGLWGIEFGDGGAQSGPTDVLYFNAGGAAQTTGVFGAIAAN
jgi:uncharacterized protein (TIGR03118 family)